MSSDLRKECQQFIEHWVSLVEPLESILDVGIAGDPKPGGNYELFLDKEYKTADIDPRYQPDYVLDITQPWLCEKIVKEKKYFDLVILSNTIEHTYEPLEAIKGAASLLKQGGHLIIDCPWTYPYHAADSFPDCWRISDDGMKYLLEKAGLELIGVERGLCTSALAQRLT